MSSDLSSPEVKRWTIYSRAMTIALGGLYYGYVLGVFNPLLVFLSVNVFPEDQDNLLLMTSLVPIGAAIGSLIGGKLASQHGRKVMIHVTDFLAISGVMLTVFTNVNIMLVGRFICGLCVGFNSCLVPMYINEISPIEMNSVTGTFISIFISAGVLISFLMGLGLSGSPNFAGFWYKFMLFIPGLIAGARLFLMLHFFQSETPRFLVYQNKEEEAQKILLELYNEERSKKEFELIIQEKNFEQKDGKALAYIDLIKNRSLRKRLLIAIGLCWFQQFSGISAIIFYSTKIFSAGITDPNDDRPLKYTVGVGVTSFCAALLSTFVLRYFGRRTLLICGEIALIAILTLLAVVNTSSFAAKIFIYTYLFCYGISLGVVRWVYVAEILPDIAIGIATLMNWTACILLAQLFPILVDKFGTNSTFFGFALVCVGGLLFVKEFIKETMGKNSLEISKLFDYEENSNKIAKEDNEEAKGLLKEEENT